MALVYSCFLCASSPPPLLSFSFGTWMTFLSLALVFKAWQEWMAPSKESDKSLIKGPFTGVWAGSENTPGPEAGGAITTLRPRGGKKREGCYLSPWELESGMWRCLIGAVTVQALPESQQGREGLRALNALISASPPLLMPPAGWAPRKARGQRTGNCSPLRWASQGRDQGRKGWERIWQQVASKK